MRHGADPICLSTLVSRWRVLPRGLYFGQGWPSSERARPVRRYTAPRDAQLRWVGMDPTNTMNPGVGGLSYERNYGLEQE